MEESLKFEIQNKRPVELADLTVSLNGLADEFRRHLERSAPEVAADDVRLYVKEIRPGSIVAEVIPYAASMLPFVGYANTAITFCKHLKDAYRYLIGQTAERPDLNKHELQNLSNIIEPIAKDGGSQILIGAINIAGNVRVTINSVEANAAQNAIRRQLEQLKEPTSGMHEKVVLYWYQARGDLKSTAGDRAVIESIQPGSVKAVFANDKIKLAMVLSTENPFREAYVVDVVVETINGKPALYKIVELHDKFERET